MKTLLIFVLLAVHTPLEEAILALGGVSCVEELSADMMSRFERLHRHPLDLNRCGRSALLASGLLSEYQVASLLEYRSRTGDVMSWSELALVDGFSAEFVRHLRHFTTVSGGGLSVSLSGLPAVSGSAAASASLTAMQDTESGSRAFSSLSGWNGRLRLEAESRSGHELYWTFSHSGSSRTFSPGTLSAAYYGRGTLSRVVLGHFNARFGQGLVQWSGFSLSGFSSIQSFSRNATGITPTGSVSAEYCGAAAELDFGSVSAAMAYSVTGSTAFCSLTRRSRRITASVNASVQPGDGKCYRSGNAGWCVSADCKVSVRKASLFAEAGYAPLEGGLAACTGILFAPAYGYRYALLLRHYAPGWDERSTLAAGGQYPIGFSSVEYSVDADGEFRARFLTTLRKEFSLPEWSLTPSFRYAFKGEGLLHSGLSELRHELRLEIEAAAGSLRLRPRFDFVYASGVSLLGCAEAGWDAEALSAFVKAGTFNIPDWDGRIYVYNRSLPGTFSVPAYRGRGYFVSTCVSVSVTGRQKVFLAGNTVSYPRDPAGRDGKVSLSFMWQVKF